MAADDDAGGRGAKQRYLDAGVELLRIQGPGIVASDIRIADVAERVGVSPAAVYKLWSEQGGQEQFRRDLARHAYRTIPRNQITGEVARAAELAIDLDSSFAELVRVCADTDLRSLTGTPDSMAVLYALYAAAYHDESLVDDARESLFANIDQFVPLYDAVLEHFGMRIRAGWTSYDLGLALEALADGFVMRHLLDPDGALRSAELTIGAGEPTRQWSLFAFAVYGIVANFVEPVPDASA